MTLSPSESRARSRRGTRAPWSAAVAAFVTLLALVGAPTSATASAAAEPVSATQGRTAATPDPTPTPSDTPTLSGEVALLLAPIGGGVVAPGQSLTASVTVDNGTELPTAGAEAVVSVGLEALPNRAALDAWLGGTEGATVQEAGGAQVEPVASGARQTVAVTVAADDAVLAGKAPGVYPLAARVAGPEGELEARSVIVVPDPAATAAVAAVVPITAPALSGGLLTADELSTLTAPGGDLDAQLTGVEGTAAILAIDPAIPASIRVLGDSAPEQAAEWLDRLLSLPNSRFATQFGDADVATQLRAGLTVPLQPTSLLSYMDADDFAPGDDETVEDGTADSTAENGPSGAPSGQASTPGAGTATPGADSATPSATPSAPVDPSAPVYPDLAELLSIGNAREAVYWPAGDAVAPDTVAGLAPLGTESSPALTLVPSDRTAAGSEGAAVPARGDAGGAGVLAYDSRLSDALQTASLLDDAVLRGAELATASAELAFAKADAPGAALMVAFDRSSARSYVALDTAIAAALEAPGVTALSLPGLIAVPPTTTEIVSLTDDEAALEAERAVATSALIDDEARIGRFSSIMDDAQLLTGPERAELLQLLGVSWLATPAARSLAVTEHRTATEETLASVEMLPPSTTQLISADSALRPWVRNDLPWPVNLELRAAPDDVRLDVQEVTAFTVPAGSNARVEIPVQARLGNGEVQVDLQLRSPTLEPIGQTQSVEVVVSAEWESIGLIVLASFVGLFLVIGVIRTVRRLRRRKTADAADGAA
ncbi:hypothetical protein FBY40_0550 [Microbacterium sp. SLBN-154]|uniref:DUF6049 family protein n=1 Tax=Microbacterium sp. SLBN-154 TaxID=2768458 RepID=UPI00114D563A|nr:DUF6049 family protein [Microbacterium sp. SLBN-154]TQK18064.1 hypothetical protein FBY40_0550 [Microbacterium sp. SLBN-154]